MKCTSESVCVARLLRLQCAHASPLEWVCFIFTHLILLSIIGKIFPFVIWASIEIDNRFSNRQPIHANAKVDRALISPRTIRVQCVRISNLYGKQMKVLCCALGSREFVDWLVYSIVLSMDFKPLNGCEKISDHISFDQGDRQMNAASLLGNLELVNSRVGLFCCKKLQCFIFDNGMFVYLHS